MKHNTFSLLSEVSSLCFSDPPCHSEGLWPARGWSQWLALRQWSPRSCPTLLRAAGCSGPTSTEHPRDGEWITARNLMNYKKKKKRADKLKTEALTYACFSSATEMMPLLITGHCRGEEKTPTWCKVVCCCWVVWSATQSAGISSIL